MLDWADQATVDAILTGTHVYPHEVENLEKLALGYERYLRRDRSANVAMVRALVSTGYEPDVRLGLALARCTSGRRCRSPFCAVCKYRHIRRFHSDILGLAPEDEHSDLVWVTIIAGATDRGIPDAEEIVRRTRNEWIMALDEAARRDDAFTGVKWRGRFEVDLIRGDGLLKRNKRAALQALGWAPDRTTPWLVPHLHKVVYLNGVASTRLEYWLRKRFPGPYRVVIKRQRRDKSTDENLRNLAGYCFKALLPTTSPTPSSPQASLPSQKRYDTRELSYFGRMYHDLGGLAGLLDLRHDA